MAGHESTSRPVGTVRSSPSSFSFPPFLLDPVNRQLWRESRLVPLKPKAFDVLRYLVERPRRLVTKQELLGRFWGDVKVTDGVLKTHLGEIRHALGERAAAPCFIETVHGHGYRFIGAMGGPLPADSPVPSDELLPSAGRHLVGRHAELKFLQSALRRALSGQRQVVFITGEPGIGKTTLVSTFMERLQSERGLWLSTGQCIDQYGKGEPYMPVLEALRRLCRGPRGDELTVALRRQSPRWLLNAVGLECTEASDSPEQHTAGLAPERMLRMMTEALESLSASCPGVLVLEDLQWADYSTLDLISYIAQRSGTAPLLVIGTYRPLEVLGDADHRGAVLGDLLGRARCEESRLYQLDQDAISQYLGCRFPGHEFPPQLAEVLGRRTAGHPLFMCRVVDQWVDSGLLHPQSAHGELMSALNELSRAMPESVLRMIEAEFDRLRPFEQKVLQAAAAAGTEFSTAVVASAIEEDPVTVDELCTSWARRGRFLRHTGMSEWPDGSLHGHCQFTHALYHQVFYERTGVTLRTQLHRRIGERQEAGHAELAPGIASELAMHFERALDYPRAVRYLHIAGEQALRRSACREAVDHLARGLYLLEKSSRTTELLRTELELHMPLGVALSSVRGYAAPEVEKVYARARELCHLVGHTPYVFPTMAGTTAFYMVRGAHAAALEVGRQFLTLAEAQTDPAVVVEANLLLGSICVYRAEFSDACSYLECAIAQHRPERDHLHAIAYKQNAGVAARAQLSWALWAMGLPDEALKTAEEALELAERLAHPLTRAFALLFLAAVHQFRRESNAFRERAEALVALATEHDFMYFLAMGRMLLGSALVELGELAGVALIRQGWAGYQATGADVGGTYFRALLAQAYAAAGRTEDALRVLQEALLVARCNEEHFWEPELYRIRAELLLRTGASHVAPSERGELPGSTEDSLLKARDLARQYRSKSLELRAVQSLECYLSSGAVVNR